MSHFVLSFWRPRVRKFAVLEGIFTLLCDSSNSMVQQHDSFCEINWHIFLLNHVWRFFDGRIRITQLFSSQIWLYQRRFQLCITCLGTQSQSSMGCISQKEIFGIIGEQFFLKNGCYSCSPTDSVKVLNSKNRIGECYVFVIWSKISQSDFRLENRTYLE